MFFARIVIPRSRSWSFESRMQSPMSWLARNWPDWRSMASTSVVLPWSTWAMIATFRISSRRVINIGVRGGRGGPAERAYGGRGRKSQAMGYYTGKPPKRQGRMRRPTPRHAPAGRLLASGRLAGLGGPDPVVRALADLPEQVGRLRLRLV